jgi:hypothetical protein
VARGDDGEMKAFALGVEWEINTRSEEIKER